MPGGSRIDTAGALHHLIVRGIGRREIFAGDDGRENFLRRPGGVLEDTRTACYARVLMFNRIHPR